MKIQFLWLVLALVGLLGLLAGCNFADDAVRLGDDFLRLYGDDIPKIAGQVGGAAGDDFARLLASSGDDMSRTLLYKSNPRLTAIQANLVRYLIGGGKSEDEAGIFFQAVCTYISHVSLFGKPPEPYTTQTYIENLAGANNIRIISTVKLAQDVGEFATAVINNQNEQSFQAGAKLAVNGLCWLP